MYVFECVLLDILAGHLIFTEIYMCTSILDPDSGLMLFDDVALKKCFFSCAKMPL